MAVSNYVQKNTLSIYCAKVSVLRLAMYSHNCTKTKSLFSVSSSGRALFYVEMWFKHQNDQLIRMTTAMPFLRAKLYHFQNNSSEKKESPLK